MTDPCEGKYDIVPRLRDHTNRDDNDIAEAATYIERLRAERDALFVLTDRLTAEHDALRAERAALAEAIVANMPKGGVE